LAGVASTRKTFEATKNISAIASAVIFCINILFPFNMSSSERNTVLPLDSMAAAMLLNRKTNRTLIKISAAPLKSIESDFAVDSSGFSTGQFMRWLDVKYGTKEDRLQWLKLHLMCGVKTNIVTSVEISDGYAHDYHYFHKRSNIETTFHMIKSKFGQRLRSRTLTAQINEALCKVLCHNLCCVIQSVHELGIETNFEHESVKYA
jgi:hypothetical protein